LKYREKKKKTTIIKENISFIIYFFVQFLKLNGLPNFQLKVEESNNNLVYSG